MEETQANNPSPIVHDVNSSSHVHTSGKYPRMATFWERAGAYFIDYIIISVAGFGTTIIFNPTYFINLSNIMKGGTNAMSTAFFPLQMIATMFSLVIFFGYFAYFYSTRGQTIGKMALKIKVVRAKDLKYLTIGEALLRELIRVFLSGLVFCLGYLWYFMSEKRQTWHDSIAASYVVKTDDAGNLLMDGPASYKKEPVKTFGCCGAMLLVFILLFAAIAYAAVMLGTAVNNGMQGKNIDSEMMNPIPPGIQYKNDNNVDMQYNFDMNPDGEQNGLPVNPPATGGSGSPVTTY